MIRIEYWNGKEWVHCGEFHREQIAWISLGSDNKDYRTVDSSTGKVLTSTADPCTACGGSGEYRYYHDAGDHFGAGSAPDSGWVTEKCPKCKGSGVEPKPKSTDLTAALKYAKSLNW